MIPKQYQGPWLTTEEVTYKTGLVLSEILYHVERQQIIPVLNVDYYLHFLVLSHTSDGQVVGHAQFQYTGPIAVQPSVIHTLALSSQVLANQEPVMILNPQNIVNYSTEYPYQAPLPSGFLDAWIPGPPSVDQALVGHFTVIIRLTEYTEDSIVGPVGDDYVPAHIDSDRELVEQYMASLSICSTQEGTTYGPSDLDVFFYSNLRYPVAVVDQLLHLNEPTAAVSRSQPFPARMRQHALHPIIWSLLETYPNARSGTLWNTLRQDVQAQTRQYDRDQLIVQMEADELLWSNPKGDTRTFKKSSFKTLISRFRQQLSDAKG